MIKLLQGDCREVLKTLPDESVHCVVTSPPYWGLRDYGTATWEGGDVGCNHLMPIDQTHDAGRNRQVSNGMFHGSPIAGQKQRQFAKDCPCGARRIDSQLGLESSPQEYVGQMVAVFREVRRVLRDDGTVWLNLGDSYAGGGHGGGGSFESERNWRSGNPEKNGGNSNRDGLGRVSGLKPKDLCGIPWRVAFALQADGWYLRQDIIWSKPNPMPESVTDRCTKAHEYIFLLSKNARYYYDADAIAEDASCAGQLLDYTGNQKANTADIDLQRTLPRGRAITVKATRNKRSVWEVATAPFSEAHFATFPPALIEPCILAGCPKECCAKCGAPVVRQTDGATYYDGALVGSDPQRKYGEYGRGPKNNLGQSIAKTIGWQSSCSCNVDSVPGAVLDPFGGAGTTGLVADRLGRNAILIELNPEYAAMANRRIRNDAGMFANVVA